MTQTNRYSVERVMMVARYYRRPMLLMAAIYAVLTAALYLIATMSAIYMLSTFFQSMAMMFLAMMFYLGPLAFADEKSRQLSVLMPARASEKFTVMALWCVIVVPLVIAASWTVMWVATLWVDTAVPLWEIYTSSIENELRSFMPYAYSFRLIQDLIPMLVVMWVVLASRRGVVAKAVLAAIGTVVGLGISGVVIGVVAVALMLKLNAGSLDYLQGAGNSGEILSIMNAYSDGFVYTAMAMLMIAIMVFNLFILWRCYRIVAHRQI